MNGLIRGADGRVLTLSVEGGRNGDWVQVSVAKGTGTRHFERASLDSEEVAAMTSFGLPETISIERALTQRPIGLTTPSEGRWIGMRSAFTTPTIVGCGRTNTWPVASITPDI